MSQALPSGVMRVGVFTYGVTVGSTGIGRYVIELTRALARSSDDLEIVLISPYTDVPLPWYAEFKTYAVPQLRRMPAAATLGHLVLHRAAHALDVDVLHDPCGIVPFLVPRPGYARVTTVHDAIPITHPQTQPLLTRLVYQTLVRSARYTADAILTVSHHAAKDLVEHLDLPNDKIYVTPNGVSLPAPRADSISQVSALGVTAPYFLCVGALHPRKNVARVIHAFLRVHEQHTEARLVIAGPPSWGAARELREVRRLVEAHDAIVFTGFVSDESLFALYAHARALVFVSLYEGFGLPALEAMAHGTPVIASNTSSIPEVVGEAGILVDPLDVGAIARAMQRVLDDPGVCARMSALGRERAASFTWDASAAATLAVYERVVADRGSGQA